MLLVLGLNDNLDELGDVLATDTVALSLAYLGDFRFHFPPHLSSAV